MAANPAPVAVATPIKPLLCACCNTPYAHLQNGVLVIYSRHRGVIHTNVIPVSDLVKMVEAERANELS